MLGREINPTVYSSAEFDKKRGTKDHFLARLLTEPRLVVLGAGGSWEDLLAERAVTSLPAPKGCMTHGG